MRPLARRKSEDNQDTMTDCWSVLGAVLQAEAVAIGLLALLFFLLKKNGR